MITPTPTLSAMSQNPRPDNPSAVQRIIAAEARARMRTGEPRMFDPDEVTSELYRLTPPRSQPQPPVETQGSLGITASAAADRQHKHRDLWVALAVALILGGPTLAVAIWAVVNSQPHTGFWPHGGEIGGLALMALGIVLAVALVRGWWLPGGFKEDTRAPAGETRARFR
jgi:hypothetical protein